tara:strand:+ start:542 stop:826 length:285 start_codon:yes stop_codon:yes gene_type:complete
MELLTIIIVLIVAVLILELSKHIMIKTFAKSIIAILIITAAFLFIIGAITSENEIRTENQAVHTGAAIVEEIKEIKIVENVIENIKEFIEDFGK